MRAHTLLLLLSRRLTDLTSTQFDHYTEVLQICCLVCAVDVSRLYESDISGVYDVPTTLFYPSLYTALALALSLLHFCVHLCLYFRLSFFLSLYFLLHLSPRISSSGVAIERTASSNRERTRDNSSSEGPRAESHYRGGVPNRCHNCFHNTFSVRLGFTRASL